MSLRVLNCGFIPLADCAPLAVAREMGFAEEEGLDLQLHKQRSWSAVRDKLVLGGLDAAHLLAPAAVAASMGLGGLPTRIDAPMVLSVNGTVIGVSPALAERMAPPEGARDIMAAEAVGRRLIAAADGRLSVGVPFPFSMHAELLYRWLGALGMAAPQALSVRTVPPPLMADAIGSGEIDAFCVGEPWGSIAAARGVAEVILPGCAIWRFAPEKVLALRRDWLDGDRETAAALMRAVWRAGRWLSDPSRHMATAEILARPAYLDVSPELIERTLAGRLLISRRLGEASAPRLIAFFEAAATFPWRSQAVWIATRLAARLGVDREEAAAAARSCFRPDVHREVLGPIGADLPTASEKVEGALDRSTPAASSDGALFLGPDRFFDGVPFDPEAPNH